MNKFKNNIDKCNALKGRFQLEKRYSNFGDVLIKMHVQGFRCHTNTLIDIHNPITAFCGLNGVGKSTLIQLAATAYIGQSPQNTYYISDFINSHQFDPNPFTENAKVEYNYCQPNSGIKQLTISRKSDSGWQGYHRRLKRNVLYIGVSSYLPTYDKSDFIYRYPKEVELVNSASVDQITKEWACTILGRNYQAIETHTLKFKKRISKINSVTHNQVNYSEPNMGYDEARSQYLIRVIESLPEKSLILIEEPEISLHPSAQYHLGCYLVDVTFRKGHQIFLTTHSELLLSALPSQSRKYLDKTQDEIRCMEGLAPSQAYSLMSGGYSKALVIFVEDQKTKSIAKIILTEIIRHVDSNFLSTVDICPVGDCDTVKNLVRTLDGSKLKVAGVLDADQTAIPKENIFKLPGSSAPEKELFACQEVKIFIQKEYSLDLNDFQNPYLVNVDHHQWFEKLSQRVNVEELALVTEVSRVYARSLFNNNEADSLINQLKQAC